MPCPFSVEVSNIVVAAALASPHLVYSFVWFFPNIWMKAYGRWSVQVFESLAWLLKLVQFSAVAAWLAVREATIDDLVDLIHTEPLLAVGGAGLIGIGQVLNAGIFRAIGHKGVYYGFKLGHVIPWAEGFPFTVVRHPQYVGSVATVWGAACLCSGMVESAELVLLVGYWTCLYVATGIMESLS
jgi:methylene-fatty-acyl-phospholipid synthase